MPDLAYGPPLMARLDALAALSDEEGRLTRLYLSPAHARAMHQVAAWMAGAGMGVSIDAVGNVVGRYEGRRADAPALLVGSHIDTVVDAGRYDGTLGVLAGIAAVEALHRAGRRLPFAIEVIAFGDEEGVRFPATLSGSRAVAGTFDPAALDARDAAGVSVREALALVGCTGNAYASCARRPGDVVGYLELHIEQGPVLEAEGLPVGVVSAINGASRRRIEVTGEAGHAGTVPMALRKDALAAAAEMILQIEALARSVPDLVATVGQIEARPGAINVVPGGCRCTLDLRAPDDALRLRTLDELSGRLAAIAEARGVTLVLARLHDAPAVACDPELIERLRSAVAGAGLTARVLPSGAGHDAMAMASLCPVGMLFVRCKGGISHNPAESVTTEDADVAVRVLLDVLHDLASARQHGAGPRPPLPPGTD